MSQQNENAASPRHNDGASGADDDDSSSSVLSRFSSFTNYPGRIIQRPTEPLQSDIGEERCCWICFETDKENPLAVWLQPCKCRGTTKWVHQTCLHRWVDTKQQGDALHPVVCPQCLTEYIIVFPEMNPFASILEALDSLVREMSLILTASIFVGSIYWAAVTFGAVTLLQVIGVEKGLTLMEGSDVLLLLLTLPTIPVCLILVRMIRWEDIVLNVIRNRHMILRKVPLINLLYSCSREGVENGDDNSDGFDIPPISDPVPATRIFCGAVLLPTISTVIGRILFDSVENDFHRALLGGLTFIVVKGILKIYLKQKQFNRRRNRRVVDYTMDNRRVYLNEGYGDSHWTAGGDDYGNAFGMARILDEDRNNN